MTQSAWRSFTVKICKCLMPRYFSEITFHLHALKKVCCLIVSPKHRIPLALSNKHKPEWFTKQKSCSYCLAVLLNKYISHPLTQSYLPAIKTCSLLVLFHCFILTWMANNSEFMKKAAIEMKTSLQISIVVLWRYTHILLSM